MGLTSSYAAEKKEEAEPEQFKPTKLLSVKDTILVDMLNGAEHKQLCWCVTDPELPDNPIVFSSDGFCLLTGYGKEEIEGRNCRFLQGAQTTQSDVDKIRKAVKEKKDSCVCLLNYRKDGSTFRNQFFLAPLYNEHGVLCYFLGVQVEVAEGKGHEPENPGWVYTLGLHA
ncbi:unnamed protein product [Discosporangium mesarthrocarpum]